MKGISNTEPLLKLNKWDVTGTTEAADDDDFV